MRIWDISPAYLNRQSLLGEHRELHGLVSILVNNKKGYSRHPETLRWVDYGWAINQRHKMIVAEMTLRGYRDQSPVTIRSNKGNWPQQFIDSHIDQLAILKQKYRDKEPGRLLLPDSAQAIWAQHKYSIMARDVNLYKSLGQEVSGIKPTHDFTQIAHVLGESLKQAPSAGGIRNALQHMWGYISDISDFEKSKVNTTELPELLREIQVCTISVKQPYLCNSTALSELGAWF